MSSKRYLFAVIGLFALLTTIAVMPAMAQDATPESTPEQTQSPDQGLPPLPGDLVIGNLDTPRGIAFDASGNLLVAVVGSGGEQSLTAMVEGTETTARAGLSGRIISVASDGTSTDVLTGLPSYATDSENTGIYRVVPQGDSLWVVMSGGPAGYFWTDAIAELDAKTLNVKTVINLSDFEVTNNPDGAEINSNVSDIAWGSDGTMYITNAGGNDLLSWTAKDGLKLVHAWTDNPVPTSIEVADNGDLYIGFLGAGLAPGAGRIEHWAGDKLVETFSNLNTVSDILLDGDNLYAVELTIMGDQGPGPGNVVKVTTDGATSVAEGLISPFGIAKGPDGSLYVSFGTVAFAPGMTGGVVKLTQAS